MTPWLSRLKLGREIGAYPGLMNAIFGQVPLPGLGTLIMKSWDPFSGLGLCKGLELTAGFKFASRFEMYWSKLSTHASAS